MQDTLNLRTLLRQEGEAAKGEASLHFENRDFCGFSTQGPVLLCWQAEPAGDAVRVSLWIDAEIQAECVRCLESFTRPQHIEKTYDIRMADLAGEFPEYPVTLDGNLDLEEMAYGELVLEVSSILVCREDCPGLCSLCGQRKDTCTCGEAAAIDPRWAALQEAWNSADEPDDPPKKNG